MINFVTLWLILVLISKELLHRCNTYLYFKLYHNVTIPCQNLNNNFIMTLKDNYVYMLLLKYYIKFR